MGVPQAQFPTGGGLSSHIEDGWFSGWFSEAFLTLFQAAIARSQVEGKRLHMDITLESGTLVVPLNINRLVTTDYLAEHFPAAFIEVCIIGASEE